MKKLRTVKQAQLLNDAWDLISDSIYQRKAFLEHAEKYNKCNQRYYELYEDEKLKAGAIVYTLRLNILTFSKLKLNVNANIIGIPASVSSSGLIGDKKHCKILIKKIFKYERGFTLGLNLKERLDVKIDKKRLACGKTLPTIVLDKKFNSFDEYKNKLRKSFRRRINKIEEKGINLRFIKSKNSDYDKKCHRLYLNVYNKSNEKLEKLNAEFFKNLPVEFKLYKIKKKKRTLAWYILVEDGKKKNFFLAGIDYKYNKRNSLYFNMLLDLLKKAMKGGYNYIDLGQSAEMPKIYFGGQEQRRYMFAHHTNPIFCFFIKIFKNLLEYNRIITEPKVFK